MSDERERAVIAGCLMLVVFLLWLAMVGAGFLVQKAFG